METADARLHMREDMRFQEKGEHGKKKLHWRKNTSADYTCRMAPHSAA